MLIITKQICFMKSLIALLAIISFLPAPSYAQRALKREPNPTERRRLASALPESVGMSSERLAKIEEAVLASIERKETPGAVVLVGRQGRIVYRKAFGDRSLAPRREPMTLD